MHILNYNNGLYVVSVLRIILAYLKMNLTKQALSYIPSELVLADILLTTPSNWQI